MVKLSSLGDVLHTLPALTDAAAALPDIRFDWAVEEAFIDIPGWHPAVDRVIPVALRRWRKTPLRSLFGAEWRAMRAQLRAQPYDRIIDAQGLIKSAFIARQASGPRAGLDRHSAREGIAALTYRHRFPVPRALHAVQRTRCLFAQTLGYDVPQSPAAFSLGDHFARSSGNEVWLLHGTAREEKTWPEAHWRELARRLGASGHRVILPWGNAAEQARARRIAAALDEAAFAGAGTAEVLPRLSLTEIATRLASARAAVAVDTGLGHLAGALEVPCVSLYGPTDPALIGVCGPGQQYLCARTEDACSMTSITVDAVFAAVQPYLCHEPVAPLEVC